MPEGAVIQVRIDAKTKTRAANLFKRMGLSTSDAVRLFINQALEEKGLPFHPHIPNAETKKAIGDAASGRLKEIAPAELRGKILGDECEE